MKARTEWQAGSGTRCVVVVVDHNALRKEPKLVDGRCLLIRLEEQDRIIGDVRLSRQDARELVEDLQEALALCGRKP
jgi:hypothetical protein